VAVPGPARSDRLPFGVTLLGPAFHDERLLTLAAEWTGEPAGAPPAAPGEVELVVVGAHLRGLPLNHQLTDRGARLLRAARTAPAYRLYALPGGDVARPGLVRVAEGGAAIEAEVWALAPEAVGTLLAQVPAPLGFGRVRLDDGSEPLGFICEPAATAGARDVTEHGGWRAFLAANGPAAVPA
jgi:allophanate hydrolase